MTSPLNFHRIGLLYHAQLPQSRVLAAEMLEFIEDLGASAWVAGGNNLTHLTDRIPHTDLLITLGGDGSMIRAAHLTLNHPTVIMGVNQGRLGFLTEVQPAEWPQRFEQILTGSYWIEERLVLQADYYHAGQHLGRQYALNEVAISRAGSAHVIRLETFINQTYLTTYTADGMIMSTPTGSTAYALAVGGPILPPTLKNILLVPVAPHLSFDRAVVLSEGDLVKLIINTKDIARLTADGQADIELANGDTIEVSTSPYVSRFLRLRDHTYFYQTLMKRLGWPQTGNQKM